MPLILILALATTPTLNAPESEVGPRVVGLRQRVRLSLRELPEGSKLEGVVVSMSDDDLFLRTANGEVPLRLSWASIDGIEVARGRRPRRVLTGMAIGMAVGAATGVLGGGLLSHWHFCLGLEGARGAECDSGFSEEGALVFGALGGPVGAFVGYGIAGTGNTWEKVHRPVFTFGVAPVRHGARAQLALSF